MDRHAHSVARLWKGALFGLAVLLATLPVATADVVGRATNLRVVATQTPPRSGTVELVPLAPIFLQALLATSPRGALEVTFTDGSQLSISGASTVVVDAYVFAGPRSPGQQVIRYTKGLFRFVSGSMPKDRVRIETPTVSVGIRGTVVRTIVEDDGTTTVGVDDGQAFVTSKQTGQSVTLAPGEKVTLKPNGEFTQVRVGKVEGCN